MDFLVLNSGSTSQKLALVEIENEAESTLSGAMNCRTIWVNGHSNLRSVEGRREAIEILLAEMERETGRDRQSVDAIGHRVVHGGSRFSKATVIDRAALSSLQELTELAPLHNSHCLEGIEYCFKSCAEQTQIAVFDTAFHCTIPEKASVYALPYRWYQNHGIRRFGFHGINVEYCIGRLCEFFFDSRKSPARTVVCHLGGGCSVTAVLEGRSVDTTMGFTPLEGLVMATRSGSIDPGILSYIAAREDLSLDELEAVLNRDSGLKGISGLTGDMQELLTAREAGIKRAELAFDIFVNSVTKHIAAMAASLNGIDALVFTGGIGENSSVVRQSICQGLSFLGVEVDPARCAAVATASQPDCLIAEDPVAVAVIKADEFAQIASQCRALLSGTTD
ncbi:acetate/propionate family kinase [bacterium]|nr:acetate/propionate family kinase [bacterium]